MTLQSAPGDTTFGIQGPASPKCPWSLLQRGIHVNVHKREVEVHLGQVALVLSSGQKPLVLPPHVLQGRAMEACFVEHLLCSDVRLRSIVPRGVLMPAGTVFIGQGILVISACQGEEQARSHGE